MTPADRRQSDDDFAKMSMLSMRGGGFVVRNANSVSTVPELQLPELDETTPKGSPANSSSHLHGQHHLTAPQSNSLSRSQSEKCQRGHRRSQRPKPKESPLHHCSSKADNTDGMGNDEAMEPLGKPPTRM